MPARTGSSLQCQCSVWSLPNAGLATSLGTVTASSYVEKRSTSSRSRIIHQCRPTNQLGPVKVMSLGDVVAPPPFSAVGAVQSGPTESVLSAS